MIGDCNIGNVNTANNGPASYRFGESAANPIGALPPNQQLLPAAWSSTGATAWAWTANDLHQKSGNLGMADGSCQSVSISGLHTYLSNSTNTVPTPEFCFPW